MPRQCRDPKCIANKEKLTTHKYEDEEKDPRPSSILHRNFLKPQNENQKRTKPKLKFLKDDSKKSKTFNNSKTCRNKKCRVSQSISGSSILAYLQQKLRIRSTKSNTFKRISGSSQNYTKQKCICKQNEHRKDLQSGSLHGHVNSQNGSIERSKRRRKRSRRRHKKTLKRESDQLLKHDCFTTLCICVRGRSSNELRTCKCTSSREVPSSDHECCCVKARQKKRTHRLTFKSLLRNDIRTDRYTADPSSNERKPRLKHLDELFQEKTNEERNVITKGLNTIRKGINRFGVRTIKLFKFGEN